MGTLGKLLLVGNLFLAAGVVYAATADWTARKNLQANALRHQLILSGMPVVAPADITGDSDSVPLGTGSPRVETVTKTLLTTHFQNANGDDVGGTGPVKAQLDEVVAVKAKIDAKLGGSAADVLGILCGKYTPDARRQPVYSPGVLTHYAESFLERDAVRRLADTSAIADRPDLVDANAKQARTLLERKFRAVETINPALADAEATDVKAKTDALKKAADDARAKFAAYEVAYKGVKDAPNQASQDALAAATAAATTAARGLSAAQAELDKVFFDLGTPASRDELDRARRAALLLVYAGESAGWQKRAVLVVGLRGYAQALTDQATRLERMATSAEQQITLDQARFSDDYQTLQGLAAGLAVLLGQQVGVRVAKESERTQESEAVTARRLKLAEKRAELVKLRAEIDATLTTQAAVESKLLDTQKQVSDTLRKNADLEAALTAAESKAK